MTRDFSPRDPAELAAFLADASAQGTRVAVAGAGTKNSYGRPAPADARVVLSAFAGIVSYEPEEMVLVAGAATPLADIVATLAARRQMLAFEPPEWAPLWGARGGEGGGGTIGGAIACNLSGSRRFKAGAARDHLLGLDAVSGAGEVFKAGGRVVKNVTGYDLAKLFAGSLGTLAVATRLVLRAVPLPERRLTLAFRDLGPDAALALLGRAASSPLEPSGLAFLPEGIAGASSLALVRLEGTAVSVAARARGIAALGPAPEQIDDPATVELWARIGDASFFAASDGDLWRVSLPPASGAAFAANVASRVPGARHVLDWAGGLVWLALPPAADASAGIVRGLLRDHGGGHATLVRAPDAVRAAIAPFEPEVPALAALAARVKAAFDPAGVLSPGRMVEGR